MLKSSSCGYRDAYILVKRTVTAPSTSAVGAAANNVKKRVIIKNCAPFTERICEINYTQVDNVEYLDIVISIYNLMEYCAY